MINVMEKMVLIVDKSLMSIFLLGRFISSEKVRLISAEDGLKAVTLCQKYNEIGLVIMDIELPLMDGIEATRNVKKYRKGLPVILHSACSGYKERAAECGCDEFINEPMNRKIVVDLLKKYLE